MFIIAFTWALPTVPVLSQINPVHDHPTSTHFVGGGRGVAKTLQLKPVDIHYNHEALKSCSARLQKCWQVVNRIHLILNTGQWWALVNTVTKVVHRLFHALWQREKPMWQQQIHYSKILSTIFYIAPTRLDAIISPFSGSLHQNFFKTHGTKIIHDTHTYVVASMVLTFTGFGLHCRCHNICMCVQLYMYVCMFIVT